MLDINDALKAIGYGLLVLFFAVGAVKTCASLADLKRPEAAFKLFIRFILAKAAVGYGLDLMLAVFTIIQGMVSSIIAEAGVSTGGSTTLPQEIVDMINDVGFLESIPLWVVTLLGGLFITVLAFIMILTVYCPHPAVCLCGGTQRQYREKLPAVLRRGVPGGRGDCPGLHHLFGHGGFPACGGHQRVGSHRRLELCGGTHL